MKCTKKTYKAVLAVVVLSALLVGVYMAGFYHASYQRYASYEVTVSKASLHTEMIIERLDGSIERQYHAGIITTIGFDKMQDQLGDSASATTEVADVISLSTSVSAPSNAWTQVPSEITTGGLARAKGTYTRISATQWTISYQFTATAPHTNVQLTGLQWKLTPLDNNLFGADQLDPVTLNIGEKVTITATVTLS